MEWEALVNPININEKPSHFILNNLIGSRIED